MNNLREQKVSDETQETNSSLDLSRECQSLVHTPKAVLCEDQIEDSKRGDSIVEQEDHLISPSSAANDDNSSEAAPSLDSPVFDLDKKSKIQELVEFCLGGNNFAYLDSILKCQFPNAVGSPLPQSVCSGHSEKEDMGNLEGDLDGVPTSRMSSSDGSLPSGYRSLHSGYSVKEEEHSGDWMAAPGHSPHNPSSPKSETLEMEGKSEIDFFLSSRGNDFDDDARREHFKSQLSIGGASPSPGLESDEYELSGKEEKHDEHWAAVSERDRCNVPSAATSELANCPEFQILKMIKQLKRENTVEEEFELSDGEEDDDDDEGDDDDDDEDELEHILYSVCNSKTSTIDRSASIRLESECSNHSNKELECKDVWRAAPENNGCDFSSVVPSKAAQKSEQLEISSEKLESGRALTQHKRHSVKPVTSEYCFRSLGIADLNQRPDVTRTAERVSVPFPHLAEQTDSISKLDRWANLQTSLKKEDRSSHEKNADRILLTDSNSVCHESALDGRLAVTGRKKNKGQQGSEIEDEFSEVSELSELSEFSGCSTNAVDFSVFKTQQSLLLKKLSSILDSTTFQELLSVIKLYNISLQKKKDHCEKLAAKVRQAEKENERMNRLSKETNYESSYLKQMIKELELQRNVRVNKTNNDELIYQRIKLENNELIFTSSNLQNLLQEQVSIQKEINEERNGSIKDLERQLSDLREELKQPHMYGSEEKVLLESIEILKEKLDDASQDLILNAMIMKNVCSYDNQMPSLKSELAAMTACLEKERQSCEMLKIELESTHVCLNEAKKEAEFLQEKHKQESKHLQDELRFLRDESKDVSTKLLIAEANEKDGENKLSRISKQLNEMKLHVENLQWEKDQAVARSHELKKSLDQCKRQLEQNRTFNENREQQMQDLQDENTRLKADLRKVQQDLQESLYEVSVIKGTLENNIRHHKAVELEKAELIKKLDQLKRVADSETKRANQNKEERDRLDIQLKEELLKNTECQKKNWRLHSLAKSTKKMLQDQRIHDAEMAEIKETVSMMKTQLTKEKALCGHLEKTNKHLKEELDQEVRSNNKLKDDLNFQREQTENDLQSLKQRLQLAEQLLLSQSEASEKNKKTFEDTMLRHEQALQEKERELAMLDECRHLLCSEKERFRKLYNEERQHCRELESQLRMAEVQLQTSNYT